MVNRARIFGSSLRWGLSEACAGACSMPKPRSREAFPPVEVVVSGGLMIITGGLIKAHGGVVGFAVQTTARLYKGQEVDFVAARTNDHWLLKAVGGESAVKGHCRSSELLTQLKDKTHRRRRQEGRTSRNCGRGSHEQVEDS